jgi:hypothetical protein
VADTFASVWRAVRLHCPLADPLLCQYWTRQAYQKVCDRRNWSFLRAESQFLIGASKTGTCNLTRNSATVSGGTLAYAATDAGRQFRVGSAGILTIIDADASSYTLERVWGGDSATLTTATVLDAFLTCPADFRRFIAVLDTQNSWQLHLWVTEDELNTWDASRTSTGTPWAVVSRKYATAGPDAGRVQYELYPYQISQKNYPYFYQRSAEDLDDDTALLGPLATAGSSLVTLALAEAAEWPGTETRRNPYFNPALARMKRDQAEAYVNRLEVMDEEIYLTWLETISRISSYTFAPIDSRFMQSHDVEFHGASMGGW